MQRLESLSVDEAFRSRVQLAADRLDPNRANGLRVIVDDRWQGFADQLELQDRTTTSTSASMFVIGRPAAVFRAIADEHLEVGFVMPVAQMRSTLIGAARGALQALSARPAAWRAGWSPQDLDRLLVTGDDATVEFVIGNARRTPETGEADTTGESSTEPT